MKRRAIWFFLALLGSGCDVMLGIDGDYSTAPGAGGAGQTELPNGASSSSSGASSSSSGQPTSTSSSSGNSSGASGSSSSGQPMPQPEGQLAQVVAGHGYTCARTINGQVKCWGFGWDGQLGLGNIGDNPSLGTKPEEMGANLPYVMFGQGRTAIDIATNPWQPYVCAVLSDGSISCWGEQVPGLSYINLLLPTSVGLAPSSALKVAVGVDHACALLASGGVLCWGSNRWGQFGNGEAPNSTDYIPPKYENEVSLGMGRSATALAAGDSYTCALLDNGTVKCWGYSGTGALGLAGTTQVLTPSMSPAIDFGGKKALTISSSNGHVCALLDDKSVSCWGTNDQGQLGLGNTVYRQTPVSVPLGQPARDVTAGYRHTCVALDSGAVKCWGENSRGQLGLGNWGSTLLPTGIADLGTGVDAAQIATGYKHSCALLQNGTLKCWGFNAYGELGIGQLATLGDEPNEMGDNLPNVLFF